MAAGRKGSAGKRLASSKLKASDEADAAKTAGTTRKAGASRPSNDANGKAAKHSREKADKAKHKADLRKKITAIVIAIFAVIMALSMMLPSLSTIFVNNSQNGSTAPQQDAASSDDASLSKDASSSDASGSDASGSDASASSASGASVAAVDAQYQDLVARLEKKYQSDNINLATLLNLGNDYMNWGYSASTYASSDADKKHVSDLFSKATDYYNQYLKLNDSSAVKVNIALCQLYQGNTDEAVSELEALTKSDADFGPAWSNLGLAYEMQGSTDKAKAAYEQAEKADADDEYGAKSLAERRLAAMKSSSSSTGASATGTSASSGGLADALASASGTTF